MRGWLRTPTPVASPGSPGTPRRACVPEELLRLAPSAWLERTKQTTNSDFFVKLATANQEEELTEDLCGVGLLEGHSVRLGEVDVGAGLSEGG